MQDKNACEMSNCMAWKLQLENESLKTGGGRIVIKLAWTTLLTLIAPEKLYDPKIIFIAKFSSEFFRWINIFSQLIWLRTKRGRKCKEKKFIYDGDEIFFYCFLFSIIQIWQIHSVISMRWQIHYCPQIVWGRMEKRSWEWNLN